MPRKHTVDQLVDGTIAANGNDCCVLVDIHALDLTHAVMLRLRFVKLIVRLELTLRQSVNNHVSFVCGLLAGTRIEYDEEFFLIVQRAYFNEFIRQLLVHYLLFSLIE